MSCRYSAERKCWYVDNVAGNIRPRRWLHARCAVKLNGHSFADLEMLAADRRAALRAAKREAERAYGHQFGRQRRARSKAMQAVTA